MLATYHAHSVLLAVCGIYVVAVPAYLLLTGNGRFYEVPLSAVLNPLPLVTFAFAALVAVAGAPRKYWRRLDWRGAMLVYLLTAVVASSFLSAKRSLIWTVPFTWDPMFASADAWLHGGEDPWRWLSWLYARPKWVRAVDAAYFIWIPLQLVVTYLVAWWPASPLRTRYLLTYALLWILLGTLAAGVFGSVGPCYYGAWTGDTARFGDLVEVLERQSPLVATSLQRDVWSGAMLNSWAPPTGVSAMPSLHVAVATLLALLAWQTRHIAVQVAGVLYLVIVQIGSVALGWHYAIDGYVGTAAAWAIWHAVGAWQRRRATFQVACRAGQLSSHE